LYETEKDGVREVGVVRISGSHYAVGYFKDGEVERIRGDALPAQTDQFTMHQRLLKFAAKNKLQTGGNEVVVRECMDASEVLPPEAATPYAPDVVTAQYKRAVAGALEMVRFGAMLVEIDTALAAGGQDPNGRRGEESLHGWLEAHCPDINYKTAMRFKLLAEGVQRACNVPAKISLSLAMPGPDGQTVLPPGKCPIPPTRLEKIQADVWDLVTGKSARQLMFDFAAADPKPKGGPNHTEKLSAEDKHAKAVADAKAVWTSGVAALVDNAKRLKTHRLLDAATIDALLLKLDVIRDFLKEAKGNKE
jgi:hypothetical protein